MTTTEEKKDKEIIALEKLMDELALGYQESEEELSGKSQEFLALKEKYDNFKTKIASNSNTLTDVERLEYEDEIEELEKSIERLKGQNEQLEKEHYKQLQEYLEEIEKKYHGLNNERRTFFATEFDGVLNNIHSRIDTLEYEPLDKKDFEEISNQLNNLDTKLGNMEDMYLEKVSALEERFKKIISNPKNKKRLRKILKKVISLEKILEEIRVNTFRTSEYDPNITLRLVESDLEKIESIMNKRRLPVYRLYCLVRSVLIGGILLGTLVILLLNEPYKTWVSEIDYSKILPIFKDVP